MRFWGGGLCSAFSNFRFGTAETGSMRARDWFAGPHVGRRSRRRARGVGRLLLREADVPLALGFALGDLGKGGDATFAHVVDPPSGPGDCGE